MILNENIERFIKSDSFLDKTPLCELLSRYESDKSRFTEVYNGWHNYSALYYFLFGDKRNHPINLFEMGIYKGSSLRAFGDFFLNGLVFGGDVDKSTFISGRNIKCFYCDQDSPSIIRGLFDSFDFGFDIIIDDGKHEFLSNLNMLENSLHKLKDEGIYIIEDLRLDVLEKFEAKIDQIKTDFNLNYVKLHKLKHEINKIDNNLLIIQK